MRNRRKVNFSWLAMGILSCAFVFASLQTNELLTQQTKLSDDQTNLEYLSSSTQRLARMILGESNDTRVVYYIDEQTSKYLDASSEQRLSVVDSVPIRQVADEVLKSWATLSDLFKLSEDDVEGYDFDAITLAADNHFDSMTDLSLCISQEKSLLTEQIDESQMKGYGILAAITLVTLNQFIVNSFSLKRSRVTAQLASLDSATGLHNRSKCQELFHSNQLCPGNTGVIVIDLNDLKTTNDQQGHGVGDQLISTFAQLLKDSCFVCADFPFLGRYGGDEFVVFFANMPNPELFETVLTELQQKVQEFNAQEDKLFHISYAEGCAFHGEHSPSRSLRELFEEADETMYVRKKEMKQGAVREDAIS